MTPSKYWWLTTRSHPESGEATPCPRDYVDIIHSNIAVTGCLETILKRGDMRHFVGICGPTELHSFGDTLEWLTAEILRRELGMEAVSRVRLENAAGGGDYDVIAGAEGALIYVETKSAPPRHVKLLPRRSAPQPESRAAREVAELFDEPSDPEAQSK